MMPKKKNGPFPKMRSAMKKTLLFAAFAAALIFSVSCNKEARNDVPEQPALRTVTFNAISPETKTVFGDKSGTKYPVLWQEGDKINYSFNFGDIPTTALAVTPSAVNKVSAAEPPYRPHDQSPAAKVPVLLYVTFRF